MTNCMAFESRYSRCCHCHSCWGERLPYSINAPLENRAHPVYVRGAIKAQKATSYYPVTFGTAVEEMREVLSRLIERFINGSQKSKNRDR